MLDDDAIGSVLARLGHTPERIDRTTWRTVIPAEGVTFRLFVRRIPGWLRLELSPLISAPTDPHAAAAFYRDLLLRNRTLMEARFALDDDGEAVLESVLDDESPADALADALDALVAATQAHYHDLARYK